MPKKKNGKATPAGKTAQTTNGAPTLEGEKAILLDLKSKGEDFHVLMGTHYNIIVDQHLAEKNGYLHARDFFAKELTSIAQSTLSLYGTVAKAFKEPDAMTYGVSKLGLLLEYENLLHAGPVSGDPGKAIVNVPDKAGKVASKTFAGCTQSDLTSAIKQLKGAGEASLPPADAKKVADLQAALDEALGGHRIVLKAKVRGRSTVVSLDNVSLSQLPTVADALKSAS